MARITEHSIPGPEGSLQILEELATEAPDSIAVICHPHPLHGGTLHNKVVHQLSRAFCALNAASVRFNFRGVGSSEGQYDNGRGELDDLVAVVAWARARWPGRVLWLAGFSFGGVIAINAAQQLEPRWLVTVAPAITHLAVDPVVLCPWLLVHGDRDDIIPTAQLLDWFDQRIDPPQLVLLEGAQHFFHGRLNDLRRVVEEAGRKLMSVDA